MKRDNTIELLALRAEAALGKERAQTLLSPVVEFAELLGKLPEFDTDALIHEAFNDLRWKIKWAKEELEIEDKLEKKLEEALTEDESYRKVQEILSECGRRTWTKAEREEFKRTGKKPGPRIPRKLRDKVIQLCQRAENA